MTKLFSFRTGDIFLTPAGKRIRLVEEKIHSADSTWVAHILPAAQSSVLPARFEKVICMDRFLRGCQKLKPEFVPLVGNTNIVKSKPAILLPR